MNRHSRSSARAPFAALVLVAALAALGAPSAHAQLFGWDSSLPPSEIERMVEASGRQLTGPVVRSGQTYLADVVGRHGGVERLVLDAHDGRLLRRIPTLRRQAAVAEETPPDAPVTNFFDSLFGRPDDAAPSRPPADSIEAPKPKPQVKRPKPEPAPVALQTPAAGANPAPSAAPAPSVAPAVAKPDAAPAVADAKPAPAPPAAAPPAAAAPVPTAPKAAPSKVNDVPVAPLE